MSEDTPKLTPVAAPTAPPATDAEKLAREEFDFYDDVKISHREDW